MSFHDSSRGGQENFNIYFFYPIVIQYPTMNEPLSSEADEHRT